MSEQQKRGLAIGLGIVWVVLIVLRVLDHPEPQRVPLKYKSGQTASQEAKRGGGMFGTIVRPIQAKARQAPFKTPKNIFAALEDHDEALKKKRAVARAKPVENPKPPDPVPAAMPPPPPPPPAPPPPSPEEIARQQARQQLGQYRFVGFLTQAGESKAFLGKGREIYIVRTGDTVEGRIQVAGIEATAIRLRDLPTNIQTTIPLVKGAK